MIVSHKHRFIFLHCRKTAGSSITVNLAQHLGPRDIQIGSFEDSLGAGIRPSLISCLRLFTLRGFFEFGRATCTRRSFPVAFNRAVKASYKPQLGPHAEASAIMRAFPDVWNSYHKFCVVRNPYERVVSLYYWRVRNRQPTNPPTFADFVSGLYHGLNAGNIPPRHWDNWPIYTVDDTIVVDRVVRYEKLHEDLRLLYHDLQLPSEIELLRAKQAIPKSTSFRELYSPTEIRIVTELFHKEIEKFGYKFSDDY